MESLKETVSVISSDLSFIEWLVRFTTIPFKRLFDLEDFIDILFYIVGKVPIETT